MSLPKALLISLGEYEADIEEAKLRAAGFATASVSWREFAAQLNDWMQLSSILQDETIVVWVVAGEANCFDQDVLSKVSLLNLSICNRKPPVSAFVFCDECICELPNGLSHVKIFHSLDPFGAKLMAARFKAQPDAWEPPFIVKSHLDPIIGLWLEVATDRRSGQPDYLIGATDAKIVSFGLGERGTIPAKSTLAYPMLGIEGSILDVPFSACASKDALTDSNACYCKIEGIPTGIFLGRYPDTETEQVSDSVQDDVTFIHFV
jgi:hypothetical protein